MMKVRRKRFQNNKSKRSIGRGKRLRLEALEARQLLAANVVNDSLTLSSDGAINVLTNDTSGSEVQTVSAIQVNWEDTNPDPEVTDNAWVIPERPSQPGVLQRTQGVAGSVNIFGDNFGDADLYRDTDDIVGNGNDAETRLDTSEGIVLPVLRTNEPVDESATNLGVVQYASEGGGPTWISIAAAPENAGENSVPFSAAFFPYDNDGDGTNEWVGGSYSGGAGLDGGGDGLTVTGSGGRYEAEVAGVTDAFADGFLFGMGGDNEDNYTRTRPTENGNWLVQHRDNSAEIGGAENDNFNLLYVPRSTQGLIGGVVDGSLSGAESPMIQSFGDFNISREADGLYRVSVPGQDITSGVMIMENYDLTVDLPRNTYFSYDDAGDGSGDILIRQFAWNSNTETPLNTDFVFFFIPFENNVSTTTDLEVVQSSIADGAGNSGLSAQGIPLSVNADGTISYDTGGALRALPAGSTAMDSFVYRATDGVVTSSEATVSISWVGVNDAPVVLAEPGDLEFASGGPTQTIDLTTVFEEFDTGDSLTYTIATNVPGVVNGLINGTDAEITPVATESSEVFVTITATDTEGESASVEFRAVVLSPAVAVINDTVTLAADNSINVLTNDLSGTEIQNVSAFQATPENINPGANDTDWIIPLRDDGVTPQRSIFPNAVTFQDGRSDGFNGGGNNGDIDLLVDPDGDFTNDDQLTEANRNTAGRGIGLVVTRDNSPVDAAATNIGVPQYVSESGDSANWIAIAAGPENAGELSDPVSHAFFPFSSGWVGGGFNSAGNTNIGGDGMTVASLGGGRYEAQVDGVTDAFSEGFLFSVGGDNEDNYTRTLPQEDGTWRIAHRDNSAEINGGENDDFNLLYIPRSAQGLIGGVVDASVAETENPMIQSFGDFTITRESDGFWRVSVPGQSVTTGVMVMQTYDLTVDEPRNAYFTYDAVGDETQDILIRQFAWDSNTETPLNTDFVFFFIPFENTLNESHALNIVPGSLGDGAGNAGVSTQGIPLAINPDGTVDYQTGDAIARLGEGQTATDTFVYRATDGVTESGDATVNVNWIGVNDTPKVISQPADLVFDEDGPAVTIDLTTVFEEIDAGDSLMYQVFTGAGGLLVGEVDGTNAVITPGADQFGHTTFRIVATDLFDEMAEVTIAATILPVDDDVRAVDDEGPVTDLVTPVVIDVLVNDFHPDTTEFSVSSAEIAAPIEAGSDADSIWTVVNSMAGINALTIQSDPNLGDVGIGRNGLDLTQAEGVLLGTVRDRTSPFGTVNTSGVFNYSFNTDTGVGAGERNTPLSAGFFPYREGWTSGQIAADGTLISGVGVTPTDIVKLQDGLFEVTVPEAAFGLEGLFFAMSGANDANIVSVMPVEGGFTNKFQVRQLDSDAGADGFEDDPISFVYIPGSVSNVIGAWVQSQEELGFAPIGGVNFGGFTSDDINIRSETVDGITESWIGLNIPGYSPDEGALIAISNEQVPTETPGVLTPSNIAVLATPDPVLDEFRIDLLESGTWETADLGAEGRSFQFLFLPYDTPLERFDNLDFSIIDFDRRSERGAVISRVGDTFRYDPRPGDASITDLGPNESVQDTFTYTIADGRAGTSTATVTVTVQGPNQAPVASNDVINLNEESARDATLTVLVNDVDPDVVALLGTPSGIPAANLAVDGSSTWSVDSTGTGGNAVTVVGGVTGGVEVQKDGVAIPFTDGVTLATVRENFDGAATNYRLVQAYDNGSGGTSLALQQFGEDAAADADVSVAHFPFADGWVAGHVDATGSLTSSNGIDSSQVVRTGEGRYQVTIPGVTDASRDGFLFVIGNENEDNVAHARAVPGNGFYQVAVRDNQQDFGDGEDGGFSFVFVPRNAQNLVAGAVDPFNSQPNAVNLSVGEFNVERQTVAGGGNEWKLSIPGQTPDTGVLILTNQDNTQIEDNFLSYEDDGEGNFIIRSHDHPSIGRQTERFTFAFIPFDEAVQPEARPVPGLLSIESVDATSAKGATLSINPDGTINYDPGTVFDALYDGDTDTDSFSYTMTDGFVGGTASATVTINISGFGAAPVLVTSPGATYYGIGDEPVGVDGQFQLVPVGVPFFDGAVATVAVTQAGIPSDVLSIRNEGFEDGDVSIEDSDIFFNGEGIGSFTGGDAGTPLTITFTADATEEAVDSVLRAVSFSNEDPVVLGGAREITLSFVDGNGFASDPVVKELELGLVYRRELQQGVDNGFGVYTGTRDAQVREAEPDRVFPPTQEHLVDFDASGATSRVFLQFGDIFGDEPGQIPADAVVTSARLILETTNPGDGATFHRLTEDWDEETVTWNTYGINGPQPGAQGQALAAFESQVGVDDGTGSTGTGVIDFSVLPDVQAWQGGETNFGWLLQGWNGNTDGWAFSSADDPTLTTRPKLEIEWRPAGAQVTSFRQGVGGYTGVSDTQIRSNQPDADFSSTDVVFVDEPTSNVLIRFDDIIGDAAGQVPEGSRIVTARLRLANTVGNAMGDGGSFHKMLIPWDDTDTFNTLVDGVDPDGVEATVEFNTQAGNPTLNPDVQGGFYDYDVTLDVQAWVNGDLDNNGWLLEFWEAGSNGWGFRTSEGPEVERPRLEIVYIESPLEAEIEIAGLDDVPIVSGDDTPSATDGTDFGSTGVEGGLVTQTFTITNTGDAALNIGDGVITGDDAAAFLFSKVPNATILPGGTVDFDVTFDPTEEGPQTAVIEINNDDSDEDPYTFTVVGTGAAGTIPEVEGVVLNEGTDSRSQITSVTVNFNTEVDLVALESAFSITNVDSDTSVTSLIVNATNSGGRTQAVLTFGSGASVVNREGTGLLGNSLADGNYRLVISAAQIQSGGGNLASDFIFGGQLAGEPNNDDFFRLYGDDDGDGDVDFDDLNLGFVPAFNAVSGDTNFNPLLDFDGDGDIDFDDLNNGFVPGFNDVRN
ncbi:MAG: DNRLRE domain-containing protein [Planctomycetota bacterium]